MNTAITIKPTVGDKDIFIEKTPAGEWSASCWCTVLQKQVEIPLTAQQVEEILSDHRRCINEVLPDTPPPLREIFLTGLTPAEFEQLPFEKMDDDEDVEEYESD